MKLFHFKTARIVCAAAAILIFSGIICGSALPVNAAKIDLVQIKICIDDEDFYEIRGYEADYVHNVFLSMRDLARVLSGTRKQFNFYNDDEGAFQIETGKAYDKTLEPEILNEDGEPAEYEPPQSTWLDQAANWTCINGDSVRYFTFADYVSEDLYVSPLDVGLMLDMHLDYASGTYYIDTESHFYVDLDQLNRQGYFDYLNGAVLGDATTGEILMSCHGDQSVPIASTTKLMTYLVIKRMIEMGKISETDRVVISENAARIAVSNDAVVYMYEGEETTVQELLCAMIICSSNESALALAEYAAGSEDAFVKMMNAMAFRLGLESAVFYNPHGLPVYYEGGVVRMVENRMSAEDLFKLARAVVLKYPEIEELATTRTMWLDKLWVEINTTNSLLYNVPDLIGLKTGTTDAAGKCLVAGRRVRIGGKEHILISVVLGAEFNSDRFEMSELLLESGGW